MIEWRRGWKAPVFAMTAALVVVAAGCGDGVAPTDAEDGLRLVATTTLVGDLVRTVAGSEIEVEVLMGAGLDPHLYKASAGDLRRMSSARAIFYNGLHLEGKMSDVLENMDQRGIRTVAVAECLSEERLLPLEGYEDLHDPHVWFDVALWAETLPCVERVLVELAPASEEQIRARASAAAAELTELHGWVAERVASLDPERRVLVTAHDAFAYFGRAYGFEVRGLLGVSTAAEAGTGDIKELADFIVARRIPAVFVETSVPRRYLQALQEAVAARGSAVAIGGSLYSDSLGDAGTPAASYVGTVRANVDTIVEALRTATYDEDDG